MHQQMEMNSDDDDEEKQMVVYKPSKSSPTINRMGPATQFINHPIRIAVCGRSTLGKTTLAVDLILSRIMKNVKQCFAVCPTFWEQGQLSRLHKIKNCFTQSNVFTKVNDGVFERIYKQLASTYPRVPTLLFVDDAAAEGSTNRGNKGAFARLCLASPHLNLTVVGVFQRLTSCSPAFRDNCEMLISFQPSKTLDITTIYEEFNPHPAHIESKSLVKKALTQCWDHSRFCVIYRPNFVGTVRYFQGFDHEIKFHVPK